MAQPLAVTHPLSRADWHRIREVLERTPLTMLLHFLRYFVRDRELELPVGAHDSAEEMIDRYHRYLLDGHLAVDFMFRALLDFAEFQNKSIYLYRISPPHRARLQSVRLPRLQADLAKARILVHPGAPAVSYSYRDPQTVRISFAETQERAYLDAESFSPGVEQVDRIVVFETDLASGLASLRFDPRVARNRHRGEAGYHDYYEREVEQRLGIVLQPLDLSARLEELEESGPLRLPSGTFLTADGGRVELSDGDYRELSVYRAVWKASETKHSGRYIWLPTESEGAGLLREVRTDVNAYPAMVRFTADVVRPEVEYVLEQIL